MSTYVNPRPQAVRVVLSDGSERVVGPWGLAFLPESVQMVRAEFTTATHTAERSARAQTAATDRRAA